MKQADKRIAMTEDEWVHAVNQKAREIELCVAFIHPSMWSNVSMYHTLREEYLTIAKTPTSNEGNKSKKLL